MSEVRWRQSRENDGMTLARMGAFWLEAWPPADGESAIMFVHLPNHPRSPLARRSADSLEAAQRAAEAWVRERTEVQP